MIQASIKSILRLHPLEPLVGFLPHFFHTKLLNANHSDPEVEDKYHYPGVRNWFQKKFGKGRKVSDMSTLVMIENEGRLHWKCYGIFLKNKFIQEFDSMGGCNEKALKSIYHWLHDSLESEGQELTSTEWCLYEGRSAASGQPRQGNGNDCGLFTILNSLCIANDLPLNLVEQSIMERARCQLWLHLMSLMGQLGDVPEQSAIDLITPPTNTNTPEFGCGLAFSSSATSKAHLPGSEYWWR